MQTGIPLVSNRIASEISLEMSKSDGLPDSSGKIVTFGMMVDCNAMNEAIEHICNRSPSFASTWTRLNSKASGGVSACINEP
jgi:hypothetical protein